MTDVFGPTKPIVSNIYEITPTALEQLAMWLETRGLRQSLSAFIGSGDLMRTSTSVYTTYTPTFTASAGSAGLGNATVVARYLKLGKLLHAWGNIVFGTTSTYGTAGNFRFALPAAVHASSVVFGSAQGIDASSGNQINPGVVLQSSTMMQLSYGATYLGVSTIVATTAPWTWTTSDSIAWNLMAEAA